jgi:uncharacterized protein (TIGR03435 family)
MMQNLLAKRFNFKFHMASRGFPGYELLVSKKGLKMKDDGTYHSIPLAQMVNTLGYLLDSLVVDRTGLVGKYNFRLRAPLQQVPPVTEPGDGPSRAEQTNEIAAALESELGLVLQPAIVRLDVLVVDHIEKSPIGD